jgi:hypothetical protein
VNEIWICSFSYLSVVIGLSSPDLLGSLPSVVKEEGKGGQARAPVENEAAKESSIFAGKFWLWQ